MRGHISEDDGRASGARMFAVTTTLPQPHLRPFVRTYVHRTTPSVASLGSVEPFVARSAVTLDFLFDQLYEIPTLDRTARDTCMRAALVGPQSRCRATLVAQGRIDELVVLFEPQGFYRLFRIPASLLTDRGVDIEAVLGPQIRWLYQRLGGAPNFEQRTAILDGFLLARLPICAPVDRFSKAFEALMSPTSRITVQDASRQAGISARQLERKSLTYTGLSPKSLARVARFERALRMRRAGGTQWTTIAHELDYHDQMHLNHDFKLLAGDTPSGIMQQIQSHHLIALA
jgi:AraC-like DNA-binding protein